MNKVLGLGRVKLEREGASAQPGRARLHHTDVLFQDLSCEQFDFDAHRTGDKNLQGANGDVPGPVSDRTFEVGEARLEAECRDESDGVAQSAMLYFSSASKTDAGFVRQKYPSRVAAGSSLLLHPPQQR